MTVLEKGAVAGYEIEAGRLFSHVGDYIRLSRRYVVGTGVGVFKDVAVIRVDVYYRIRLKSQQRFENAAYLMPVNQALAVKVIDRSSFRGVIGGRG